MMNIRSISAVKVLVSIAMGLALLPAGVRAQTYPNKPIRWIVPLPAGGGADFMTRAVTTPLATSLGQPVLIDNRPGASGTIGVAIAAKGSADGYTLVTGEMGTLAMSPSLFKKLPYDALKDLQPISLFAKLPFLLVVNPERVPVSNWQEFNAYAKARQGKLTYASFGTGSITHVMTELLKRRTDLNLVHVPYKGAAPAIQDLIGGNVDMMFIDFAVADGHVKSGRMRVIGASTKARHPQLPDMPSLQEAGVPDFDVATWLGVLAPIGTPKAVIARINKEVTAVVQSPELIKTYTAKGIIPVASSPAELQKLLRDDIAKWDKVIKESKIEME